MEAAVPVDSSSDSVCSRSRGQRGNRIRRGTGHRKPLSHLWPGRRKVSPLRDADSLFRPGRAHHLFLFQGPAEKGQRMTIKAKGLDHVAIAVTDLPRAIDVYRDALGL